MNPKRERLILAALLVIVGAVWVRALGVPQSRRLPASPVAIPASQPIRTEFPTAGLESPAKPSAEVLSVASEWGDNPFSIERRVTQATAIPRPSGFVLSGILWDPVEPSAIINGRLVVVGDELGGFRVNRIEKEQVILSDGMTTQTLTVE